MVSGHVDEGRQGSTVLRKGMIFNKEMGEFMMDDQQYDLDGAQDEPGQDLSTSNEFSESKLNMDGRWYYIPLLL